MTIELVIPNFYEPVTTDQCLQIIFDQGIYVSSLDKVSYAHSVDGVLHITIERDDTFDPRMNGNSF